MLIALGPECRQNGPQPGRGFSGHYGADVAAVLRDQLLVRARDPIDERRGRRERHDVIVGEREREHRAADLRELGGPAAQRESAADEAIAAVQLVDVARVARAGKRYVVVAPALGGEE